MAPAKERGRTATPSAPAAGSAVLAAAALAMLVAAATGCTTSPSPPSPPPSPTAVSVAVSRHVNTQALAVLLVSHPAMSAPDERSDTLHPVHARRPITVERTVLPVIGHRSDKHGVRWLQVLLPGRPNGHSGWIKQRATVAALTRWHIVVDTSERRVTVYKQDRPVRAFKAVVGKVTTPTPHGKFFVEEAVELRATDVGAPFALALSARSNVLQEYNGGPGQIALHGLGNVGGVLGSAASHGCVRLDNDAMRWLVVRIGPGVPVTIKP